MKNMVLGSYQVLLSRMQTKNVYILFPAGYSGTYLSWCLDKSELSSKDIIIDDPINKIKSDKYGGSGTCHQYHRYPTHGSIDHVMSWLILNQPKDKRYYLYSRRAFFQPIYCHAILCHASSKTSSYSSVT